MSRPVVVVVVAYGPAAQLAGAIGDLTAGYQVVVVDNSSSEETRTEVKRHGAIYIDPGANVGFAAGVNAALSTLPLATIDVLLLNPDAHIAADQLARLSALLEADAGLACVAPAHGAAERPGDAPTCWPWHTPASAWAQALGLQRRRARRFFLSGAVLLLRGEALVDVGPFDERFFLYAEDEDWQRRAMQQGWRGRFCPEIRVVHAAGGTEPDFERTQLRLHAATERYVRKWYGTIGWTTYRIGVVSGQLVRAILRRGWRHRSALRLVKLYLTGPDRAATLAGVVPPVVTRARHTDSVDAHVLGSQR